MLSSLLLLSAPASFHLSARVGRHQLSCTVRACAGLDGGWQNMNVAATQAATRVLKAAQAFGPAQMKASSAWVNAALVGERSHETLMEAKLALFEECTLGEPGEDDGKCQRLTEALDEMMEVAKARGEAPVWGRSPVTDVFWTDHSPAEEASQKVKSAAEAFGPEQKEAAEAWVSSVLAGKTDSWDALFREQVLLFGECLLSEDGSPSKCEELEVALSDFQDALSVPLWIAEFGKPPPGFAIDDEGRLVTAK